MPAAHPELLLRQCLALLPREALARASDADLLARFARDRDGDAFAALVARHGPLVLAACRRLLRDAGSAEDVAQATFLVLARKAGAVRRPEALAAWLHRTACNLALRHRRADARRRGREAAASRGVPLRASHGPVDELARRELLGAIDEEVAGLPDRLRLPVVLCCLEGRTLEDAGGRLGWTPGSVKGRLERGRAELRSRLVRRGFTLSAACAGLDLLRQGAGASLPAGFGAATLRAALAFASGVGAAGSGIEKAVVTLAEDGLRGATLLTRRVVLSLVLAAGLLGGVTAVAPTGPPDPPKAKPRADAVPALVGERKPRADRHGDPLPDGAVARLGTVRWRNANTVKAIAFSPDGKTLASASRSGIRLFDAKGKLTRDMPTADTTNHSLAFSPDGTRLACRCTLTHARETNRTAVRIWDLKGTRGPKDIGEKDVVWAGWSAAGGPLAVLLREGGVVLRDLDSKKDRRFEAGDLPDPRFGRLECSYAPEGNLLAFAGSRGAIHVWDASSGKKLRSVETGGRQCISLSLSPDGRSLASVTSDATNERRAGLWDVRTGRGTHDVAADQKGLRSVAFAPDGRTLATVGSGDIRFWDPSTGRQRARTDGGHAFEPNVAFSPDGETLATTAIESCSVGLWDVAKAEPRAGPSGHSAGPGPIDFSPDGRRVATSGGTDGTVVVWGAATGEPLTTIRRGGARWARPSPPTGEPCSRAGTATGWSPTTPPPVARSTRCIWTTPTGRASASRDG